MSWRFLGPSSALGMAREGRLTRWTWHYSQISHIACGGRHTVALAHSNGQLFAWGENESGQLGVAPALCCETNHGRGHKLSIIQLLRAR